MNTVDLHVEVRGAGMPILGIHGTPSAAVMWEHAAVRLAEHGRCITFDRRGFLRSGRPGEFGRLDLDDHVDDAAGLLDVLEATPAVVIGRSTGGLIALELARREPRLVSALVLLEPGVFTLDPECEAWADGIRRVALDAVAADPATAAEAIICWALGDEVWDSFSPALRTMFAATSEGVIGELEGVGLDLSARPRRYTDEELAAIRTPTLIVSAEDSPAELRRVAELLADRLPDVTTARVDGGHLIDPAAPAVIAFITEHTTPG